VRTYLLLLLLPACKEMIGINQTKVSVSKGF
jgi:hypothetical protein